MCEPTFSPWIRPAPWENTTRICEDRLIVTNGDTHCPSPDLCDINYAAGETYETYVRRHAMDHGIFIDGIFPEIERNLFLCCFYAFLKFGLENPAITVWPFWEDCEFLANWDFNDEDLERDVPKAKRTYRLKPLPLRRPGVERRQKKHEKPRETLKTAEGFGIATWWHLREYFIFDNVNLRITVHSSTTRLTRKRYINFAEKVWGRKTGKLFDLFSGEEEYGPEGKKKTRRIGLIHSRAAVHHQDNTVALRWLQDDPHAFATHSMMGIGADSESTGERADRYIGDDVCTGDNSDTQDKRDNVKVKVAQQEKQLEHGGYWLWIDTRKHLNDVAGEIDLPPQRDYFHVLHRKACWTCTECDQVIYYWPKDGTGKPRITEEWLAEQRRKHSERDFWNELMNEPQDPEKQTFKRDWFRIVPLSGAVPLEVRAGLGLFNSEEDRLRYEGEVAQLDEDGKRVFALNMGDPAGRELASKRGDRTAIVGIRFDAASRIWITYLRSGQWGAQPQKEEAYAATLYNKPRRFIWEIVHDSGVEKAWSDFLVETSRSTKQPVSLPMAFVKPKRIVSKHQRIEELEPYFRNGVNILETAGTPSEIELFVSQFCEYLISDHDDYPDATANAIEYIKTLPLPKEATPAEEPLVTIGENGNPLVQLMPFINKMRHPKGDTWGRSGGGV